MSHFTVMVIGEDPEKQLAPFDENLEMSRYVAYTKQQLIEKGRKENEEYKASIYAKFLADPEKYRGECAGNPAHINYVENEFPKKLASSDEEVYQEQIKYYEPDEIGSDGEVYSTQNPNAKWDWYQLGGRWSGMIKLKEGATGIIGKPGVFKNDVGIDQAKKADIANFDELNTLAIIKDGNWYEQGRMGWFGVMHNEKPEEQWVDEFKKLVESLPDETLISI